MREYMQFFVKVVQGMFMGAGAFLPGISGSNFALAFGIYGRVLEAAAHPLRNLKKNLLFFFPYLLGVAVSFILTALALDALFEKYEKELIFLFVGCIGGTLPSLFRIAFISLKEEKHFRSGSRMAASDICPALVLCICVCAAASVLMLLPVLSSPGQAMSFISGEGSLFDGLPSWICFGFAGALLGLGSLFPGVSMSAALMYLGLYDTLIGAIPRFVLPVLIPAAVGYAAVIVLFSRLVSFFIKKKPGLMSFVFAGLAASSLTIAVPYVLLGYADASCILLCAGGAAVSYILGKTDAFSSRKPEA